MVWTLFTTQLVLFKVCRSLFVSVQVKAYHSLLTDSLKCIAWKGRAVVVGFAGGKIEKVLASQYGLNFILTDSQLPLNLVLLKNIEVTGIHWGAYASVSPLSFKCGDIEYLCLT